MIYEVLLSFIVFVWFTLLFRLYLNLARRGALRTPERSDLRVSYGFAIGMAAFASCCWFLSTLVEYLTAPT